MNINRRYKLGFAWGKREHKYERITSRLLWIGVLFIIGTGVEWWFLRSYYLGIVAGVIFVLAFFVHLIARISHRMEKHTMDKIRFGKGG